MFLVERLDGEQYFRTASYLYLLLRLKLHTSVYDKRDDFYFIKQTFPFPGGRIPPLIFQPKLIRYPWI